MDEPNTEIIILNQIFANVKDPCALLDKTTAQKFI